MQVLISRTLDFIRSTESGGTLYAVGLTELIPHIVAGLPTEDRAKVHVHMSAATDLTAMINPWGFERVLANVLDNALKHSPPGDAVEITASVVSGSIQICVRDHGPGVPETSLKLLKQPFYRVDAARNADEGGVGLGLSIVDNLMRAYGGEVNFANHASQGLVVTLVVPQARIAT
jgi:signal transduction histidine kinase